MSATVWNTFRIQQIKRLKHERFSNFVDAAIFAWSKKRKLYGVINIRDEEKNTDSTIVVLIPGRRADDLNINRMRIESDFRFEESLHYSRVWKEFLVVKNRQPRWRIIWSEL